MRRDRLIWGKFYFAASGGFFVSIWLVFVGDLLLGMDLITILLHFINILVLAAGLSGLSVGLGAAMPNFRESDPSKIAVGFGGTLNLVAGLLYLLVSIGTISAPYAFAQIVSRGEPLSAGVKITIALLAILGIALAILTVRAVLRLGIRTLRDMEF
jgi:ABC-2 type transport system permease protein